MNEETHRNPKHTTSEGKAMHEYVGALHIHSNFSDGLRAIPEIVEIAEECDIDYLLFADHMTLEPIKRGMERWFGSVLSIIGYEINDTDNINHYLAFGLTEILPKDLTAQEYVRKVHEAGAVGFIAHPDEQRTAIPSFPPYPWTAWDAEGYDGIEIWNHASEWLEKLNNFNKYYHVMHPLRFLKGPLRKTLNRWDDLNKTEAMSGIGGIDAHAYPYRLGPFTIYIFRYKVLFKGIRTHILVEEPLSENVQDAKHSVLTALKTARCFISNHRWGQARGFRFEARSDGAIWNMGDTVERENVEFYIRTPLPGFITLLRDGTPVASAKGNGLLYTAEEPGAYRVEVYRKKKPWIYSNHIRLRGE